MAVKAKKTATKGKVEEIKDPLEEQEVDEEVDEDDEEYEDDEDAEYEEEEDGEEEDAPKKGGLAVVGDPTKIEDCHFKEERKKILELRDKAGDANWALAVALQAAYKDAMYESWGFSSWKQYVEDEVDIGIRKAQQLVHIQEWCDNMPTNIQKWIRSLGYAKARELVRVVTTDNIKEWRNLVDGKSLAEICKLLKDARDEEAESGGGGGGDGKGSEDIAKSMNFNLYSGQRKVVNAAITKAKGMAGTEKPSHALELICTEFMASNAGIDNVQGYLRAIEKSNGIQLVAYDKESEEIIFGSDLIASLEALDEEESDE